MCECECVLCMCVYLYFYLFFPVLVLLGVSVLLTVSVYVPLSVMWMSMCLTALAHVYTMCTYWTCVLVHLHVFMCASALMWGRCLWHPSAFTCVMYLYLSVRTSSCCMCNSSKHQGSALLCWINESLTSIATRRLWNTHRRPRLSTLNSQSFSPSRPPCSSLYQIILQLNIHSLVL